MLRVKIKKEKFFKVVQSFLYMTAQNVLNTFHQSIVGLFFSKRHRTLIDTFESIFFFFFRFLCPAVILSFLVDTIENILDKSAISYREGDRFRIEKIDRSSNPIQIQLRLCWNRRDITCILYPLHGSFRRLKCG